MGIRQIDNLAESREVAFRLDQNAQFLSSIVILNE